VKDPELLFTGVLPLILILAAILTALASFFLLQLYRRSVLKKMGQRIRGASVHPTEELASEKSILPTVPPLSFASISESFPTPMTTNAQSLYTTLRSTPWRFTLIYLLGGLGYGIVMALSFLTSAQVGMTMFNFLFALSLFAWPIAITAFLISTTSKFSQWTALIIYLVISLAIILLTAAPKWPIVWNMIRVWVWEGIQIVFVLVAFLNRRTRAVAPLIMTFAIFAMTGIVIALVYGIDPMAGFLFSGHWLANIFLMVSRAFGPKAIAPITFILLGSIGVIVFGVVGWSIIRIIRRLYLTKRISDQSLYIDSIWFIFAIIQSIQMVFEGPWWMLAGLVAFIVYKIVTGVGFSVVRKKLESSENVPQLLILRVFSLGRKSEMLYNIVTRSWRYAGNALFITGPDLVAATVEPHDFLEYLSGRLSNRFIDSQETLHQRMAEMDLAPDPDGRFRIKDFFCYDDTWKMALSRLVHESEVILMDLRSFSAKNAGCKFEIAELINHIPLDRVIFVIDKTTDEKFMRQTMVEAWKTMQPSSPNRTSRGKLNLFEYTGSGYGEFQKLLQALSMAANPI
jgi:hypothetical protein